MPLLARADIAGQLLRLYEPDQHTQQGQQGSQPQFSTAQQVMQGVLDGQLLLYATHTMAAEQHQKLYPPRAPQAVPQPQPVQQPVQLAVAPPQPAPTPPAVPLAASQQQHAAQQPLPPAAAEPAEPEDGFDEYEELFS